MKKFTTMKSVLFLGCVILLPALAAVSWLISDGRYNKQQEHIARLEQREADRQKEILVLEEKIQQYEDPGHGVAAHGALRVNGSSLNNEHGSSVQLRGMSTHGLMWYPQYTNARAAQTIYEYGGNVMRIALYSNQNEGYIHYPKEAASALFMAIENYLSADMYVIVDWHTLRDNDPNTHADMAAELFEIVSSHYGDNPAILYEICNEPNGDTDWDDVSRYAKEIIPVIRSNAPNAVILVGTPKYSTDLSGPLQNPLPFDNIMYAYHQYTATMDESYARVLGRALEQELPIFVTEWGVSEKTGDGEVALATAQEFINFLNDNGISWINWSLSNKDETSAALLPQTEELSGWSMEDLSLSGQMAFSNLRGRYDG